MNPQIPDDLREMYDKSDKSTSSDPSISIIRTLIDRIATLTAQLESIKRDTDWEENSANHAAVNSLEAQHERDQETIAQMKIKEDEMLTEINQLYGQQEASIIASRAKGE